MTNGREQHLKRFYDLLDGLEQSLGGARVLSQCDGRMGWPQRLILKKGRTLYSPARLGIYWNSS